MDDANHSSGGLISGLTRALGAMIGVHIQYAQQEARGDIGRVLVGVVLLGAGAMTLALAFLLAQVGLVVLLEQRTALGLLRSIGVVAAADALLGLTLLMVGRGKLRKPILKETRSLMKRTAKSLVEL